MATLYTINILQFIHVIEAQNPQEGRINIYICATGTSHLNSEFVLQTCKIKLACNLLQYFKTC